jgi:hypothetical protein
MLIEAALFLETYHSFFVIPFYDYGSNSDSGFGTITETVINSGSAKAKSYGCLKTCHSSFLIPYYYG